MPDINTPHSDEQDIINDVQRRAAVDRDFRDRLLNEPNAVLAEMAGQELPQDFTIRFVEKDEHTDALIVLPDMVPETTELSEAELEAVAGGGDGSCWVLSCFAQSCAVSDVDVEV